MQCTFSAVDGSLEYVIGKSETKDKIFENLKPSWNPIVGCKHDCCYCWARKLATTKLKNVERYWDGFEPKLVKGEFRKKFHNKFVFVCDMGDLFGYWVPSEWIVKVISAVKQNPSSDFLFLTKNPKRYFDFLELFPKNVVLGATIESDTDYRVANVPSEEERYAVMAELPWNRKMISIEPIMDFDFDRLVRWIKEIHPRLVHVGYDRYWNKLKEPSLAKTEQLITQLQSFTKVKRERIRKAWCEV